MKTTTNEQRLNELSQLRYGYEILLNNGQTAIFQHRNQKTFNAIIDDIEYRIGYGCFVSMTEKQAQKIKEKQVGHLLEKNDIFLDECNNLYKFDRFEDNWIVTSPFVKNSAIIRLDINSQITILGNLTEKVIR